MQRRRFFINTASRGFVAGPNALFPASEPLFFREDVEAVELYFVEPSDDPQAPTRFLDYSANTVKLAVGTTAPAAFQNSWTPLPVTITAGVTSVVAGGTGVNAVQRLSFTGGQPSEGAITLSLPQTEIDPDGDVVDGIIRTSTSGFCFDGRPVLLNRFAEIANGVYFMVNATPNAFRIANTPSGDPLTDIDGPNGEIFPLTVSTAAIEVRDLTTQGIQSAFERAGFVAGGQALINVSGSYATGFTLEYVGNFGGSWQEIMRVSSTLSAAPGLSANVSFNTNEIGALVAAGTTDNLRLEVEVSGGGVRQTYAAPAQISPDIITSTSPAPLPTITPATSFNLVAPNSDVWNVTIDNDGVLTATKQ